MSRPDLGLAALVGMVTGLGVVLIWTGWRPHVERLAVVLARFGQPRHDPGPLTRKNFDRRLGARLRQIETLESALYRYRADLRVCRRTGDEHAALVGVCVIVGLCAGVVLMVPRWMAGIPIPVGVGAAVSLVGAAAGAVLPFMALRDEAAKRRRSFELALSAYCVSVDMALRVGAGPDQALTAAAADGQGWQFGELRSALAAARARNEPPWEALARLGDEVAVTDLVQLAHAVEHVALRGASAAETVATIADSIQARITSDTEREAAKLTVRMVIPATMLLLGFLVLMAYPAMSVLQTS